MYGPIRHPFHLVDKSPWPILAALAAWCSTLGGIAYLQGYLFGIIYLFGGICCIQLIMILWWRDIIREGSHLGYHTQVVQMMLRSGIVLFILSEVMFFFSFFWIYFSTSASTVLSSGEEWPPMYLFPLDPFGLPLINTLILLLSGVAATWAHNGLLQGNRFHVIMGLIDTIFLGIIFLLCQGYEYMHAFIQMNDSVYGTTFFVTTGFHGLHVFIGTLFLSAMLYRQCVGHFSSIHHIGLEGAIWYWHFVDVVWLYLFIFMYFAPFYLATT